MLLVLANQFIVQVLANYGSRLGGFANYESMMHIMFMLMFMVQVVANLAYGSDP